MTDLGETNPNDRGSDKPPKRHWEATRKERFFDLKFSHYVEIILTIALVGIAYFQYTVYDRQAGIMGTQAQISSDQTAISIATQRAIVSIYDVEIISQRDAKGKVISWNFIQSSRIAGLLQL